MLSSLRWARSRAWSAFVCISPLSGKLVLATGLQPAAGLQSFSGATAPAHSYADSPPASGVMGNESPSPDVWGCGHSHRSGLGPSTDLRLPIVPMF